MKFTIEKKVLLSGIQAVQNVITSKITLPILSNMLLETQTDNLVLTATDLDIGISCVIPVDSIHEPGAITIPAKRFGDIIKELPGEDVLVSVKKNNLAIIEGDNCQFKIMGLPKEEFPKLPEFKNKEVVKINHADLKTMLGLTSFAVSYDEARYVLNGILFQATKNILKLIATDGKRLALVEKKIDQVIEKDISIIIPIKTIQELNRNLKEGGELSVVLSSNQVMFDLGGVVVISRLIEGEFPDYRQVIPALSENKMRVERERLLLAIKRAALLSTPDYQAVKIEVFKGKLVVSKSTPDIGESREELPVEYQGKEMVMGFNPAFLMDVLKSLSLERVELELVDSEKPGVIRTDGYVYIVLPMRLA